jgi:hypothetical protein
LKLEIICFKFNILWNLNGQEKTQHFIEKAGFISKSTGGDETKVEPK